MLVVLLEVIASLVTQLTAHMLTSLREGLKKGTNLGHCPNRGEGVRHLEFSVPTSLSVSLSSISNFI